MIESIAILASILLAGLSIFQVLLIAGLPLGLFAWGGSHRVLPVKLRIGSFIAIVLYVLFAIVILEKASLISVLPNQALSDIGIWILTVYLFIGTAMNAMSRSKYEKYTMTPITLLLSLLYLIAALYE